MSSRSEENVATCEDVACKVAAGANVEPDEPGSGSNSPMNSSSDDLAAPVTSESSTGAAGASERSEGGQGDVGAVADGEGSCDDDHERGDEEIDDEDKQSRSDQDQLASCEGDSVSRHLETDGMTERDGDQDENREEGQRYDAGREKQVSKAWEPETDAGPEEHVEDQEREEQEAKALEPNIAEYSVENFEDVVLDKSKEEQGDKACKRDIDEGRMSEIKGELEIDEDGTKNVPHQQWTEEHAAAKKETDEAVEITVQKGDSVTADGEQTGQDDKEESDGAFQSFCDTSSNSDLSVDGDSQNEESEPEREDEEQEDVEEEKYFDADDESSSSSSSCDDQAVVPPAPGGSVAMAAISNHDDGILNLDPPQPPPPQPERKPELFDQDQVRRFLREKENEVANTYRDNFTQLNQEKNDQLAKLEKSRSHVSKQLEEIQRLRSDLAKEKEHNVRMHRLTEDNVKMKEETTLRTHQLKAMGHKEMRENVMAEAKRSLQFYNFVNDVLQFDESQPDSQLVKMIGEQEQFLDKINNDPAPPSMSSSDQAVGKTRMFDVHRPAPVDYTTLLTEIHQALNQAAEAAQRSQEAKDEAERVAAAVPNPAEDMATTEADLQVEPPRFPHPPPPPPPPTNQLALIIEKVQELCPDLAPEELYASLEQLREVNSGTINGLSLERVLDFITDQLDHHDGEEGEGEEGVSACAICHEELQPDNPEASNGLSCCQDKVYHAFCITQWLEMNGRCPVCSREV